MKQRILLLALIFCLSIPALASIITPISAPTPMKPGDTPTAAQWNAQIVDFYTWLNSNVVNRLNVLTTKGDTYFCNGSDLVAVSAGSNGKLLQVNGASSSGVAYNSTTATAPLTTKGDLAVCDGTGVVARLPVGTNGYALQADNSTSTGLKWTDTAPSLAYPAGAIISWSPAAAGTSTIPSGWYLCDGNNSTPNLIGMFVIGTRPSGSSSTAAAGGYGVRSVGASGGSQTHSHSVSWSPNGSVTTGSNNSSGVSCNAGTAATVQIGHTHTATVPASATSTSATIEPSDYALVYILKQ